MVESSQTLIDETVRLRPFALHYGDALPDAKIAFRLVGNAAGPVVAVLGGISAHRIVTGAPGEGWWPEMVGPGSRSGYGASTGSWASGITSAAAATAPHPRRAAYFRRSALYDPGRGIEPGSSVTSGYARLATAIVGASYGGMVALCFAERHAQLVGHIVVLSAADRSQVLSTAWRSVQRQIVREAIARGDGASGLKLRTGPCHGDLSQQCRIRDSFRRCAETQRRSLSLPQSRITCLRAAMTMCRSTAQNRNLYVERVYRLARNGRDAGAHAGNADCRPRGPTRAVQ